ncbi:hypothetical protein CONCODRAFT_8472 [Conidiobolus coronatus NRRL 28638]|uniref:Uncharacterized protein n=1 Tax=Conidiobolus coronatus (strain ATCC 28846 / CBS 209.66 / NRRL 28638) TaxID=796925 RepID=A0A137P2K8_CONC2|nr:hypothetical protein CONCODRAFT_8472 [Conidiobolus coronatus NRRL 28638]|eukprot:KXN69134.1 hypothetical protein CONCODRAFT_8472 [Conidiobolus coronatus NRRL 28638]
MKIEGVDFSLICLAFTIIILIDFIIIELVLKLGVFDLGRVWLRVLLILVVSIESIDWYLAWALPQDIVKFYYTGAVFSVSRVCLYYHMIMQQNLYWMSDKVRMLCYISLSLFITLYIVLLIISILFFGGMVSLEVMAYVHYVDLAAYIWLTLSEGFISFKAYIYSKSKVKTVSAPLWRKIQFGIIVCSICSILDIVVLVIENAGDPRIAYTVKPPIFAFKIVFECLCFQFIKGIIYSI